MLVLRNLTAGLLCGVAAVAPSTAFAQATAPATDPAVAPAPKPATSASKRVYTPADFARYAPKTAYDMLVQVAGFTIRTADQERGLGQASENVLINGERIANKSSGAVDQLRRTPISNVERIEVLDAASLGIAGLSGQVANVVLKAVQKASGNFEWRPDFRAHFATPNFFNGSVSYTGKTGPVDYTLTVKSEPGRGGFGGEILIYDRNNVLTERRNEIYHGEFDPLTLQTKFRLDGPGSSVGNLTLGYTPYWGPAHRHDRRFIIATGETRRRQTTAKNSGWYYDVNADYDFALGPGRLKLIGLRHFDHEPIVTTQVLTFGNATQEGVRFSRNSHIGETIGRAEYGWKTGQNDWQVSFERAFNSLDQKGGFFELSPQGQFEEVPFPEGTGKVTEVRYESIATLSRPLGPRLDLQVAGGGEISYLDRVDDDEPARKFFRPKGSVTLGWRPAAGWDASLKLRRRVGQISFYDFLAQPNLSSDRENAGNPQLVPPQSWEMETEVGRELGKWGKTRLRTYYHLVEDIVDYIPLANHSEGVGNLPHATRFGVESTSTIQFDPIGWAGAKLDARFGFEKTRVKDPLTGDKRPISSTRDRWIYLDLRHDIPGTQLAWGSGLSYDHFAKTFFLTEVYRSWEGPVWFNLYVEHKNVDGMTVRADVGNILNARHRWTRYVYTDWRDSAPINFIQRNNQLIGPIFTFTVKRSF
jgi:hypothetical protein